MQEIIKKLKQLTGKEFIQLTERGNKSIKIALALAKELGKTKVLIPDQGGWLTYKKFAEKLGFEVIEIKTDYGLLDHKDLEKNADENSILISCSMPGYFVLDDMEEIMNICSKKNCLVVNDASGSIGTDKAKIGSIIIGSFGKWKPINLEYGGFIATDDRDFYTDFQESYFDEHKYDDLLEKLDELPERLKKWKEKRKQIIEDLQSFQIIHKDKEGINVIIKFDDEEVKQRILDYCDEHKLEYTICPRYIRVNEDAISIEVKRL